MSARKHRATGNKPPGGKRPGAGRPPGSNNALPYGVVQAVKALNYRVPEDKPDALKAVANRSFERIIDVLEEKVGFKEATGVLKAATMLREEICGAIAQKHEHSLSAQTDEQVNKRFSEIMAKAAAPEPKTEGSEG